MKTRLWLCVLIGLVLVGPQPAAAQTPPPIMIKYGDVIADKFTAEQTRFEYQFEAEEGDGIVVRPNGNAEFRITVLDKDSNEIDSIEYSLWFIVGTAPRQIFGILEAGLYIIAIENLSSNYTDSGVIGSTGSEFEFWLYRTPILEMDTPVSGETKLAETEYVPLQFEEGVYLVSVANSGYYDLSYEVSSVAAGATVHFYDAGKDRSIVSATFDFYDTSGEIFAGVLINPLLEDHLYAVILTTRQYMADEYEPLTYQIELSATPADRLPHSD